jgi:DNA-binding GntR family transcriptional regulator
MTPQRRARDHDRQATADGPAPGAAADELAGQLQHRIIAGDYPVGARLRQELLAEEFGVSRMPVREALHKLQAAGLVEIFPRRGAFVRGPGAQEIREAYVVRAELEGLAAELAAGLIDDAALRALREAAALFQAGVEELNSPGTGGVGPASQASWPRANDQFHDVILTASGNQRLRDTVLALHGSFPRNLTWSALSESSNLLRRNAAEHQDVLAAIEAGDGAAARAAAKRHVLRSGELVASRFQRSPG